MLAVGHKTTTPSSLNYSTSVSQDGVSIALTIYALNYLKIIACNIYNAYLTVNFRYKISTVSRPEFYSEQVKVVFFVRALYRMKMYGASFKALLY